MIGDSFLKEVSPTLTAMKNQAVQLNRRQPYLHEYYNVETFTYNGNGGLRSVLARINNAIVYALNNDEKLPRYIMLIPDKDLIEVAVKEHHDCGLKGMLGYFLDWLLKNININIETCKQDLYSK